MHSIPDPSRVRFTGPLAPYAAGLAAELALLGFASTSATNQLQLAAHLSRWLQARRLGPGDLHGPVLTEFLVDRRRDYSGLYSLQALGPTLEYLRHLGVAPSMRCAATSYSASTPHRPRLGAAGVGADGRVAPARRAPDLLPPRPCLRVSAITHEKAEAKIRRYGEIVETTRAPNKYAAIALKHFTLERVDEVRCIAPRALVPTGRTETWRESAGRSKLRKRVPR